jgi:alpha-D-xyloside xylohydrolase
MRWRQYTDFRWDRQAFPDPEAFAEGLHRQGLKLSVWQHPYISVESDLYAEGCRAGYFVRRPDGEVYVIEYGLSLAPRPLDTVPVGPGQETWNAPVAIIDLTLPAAVEWYKSLMRPVLEGGLDVFKTDFGEDIPADAVFANGMTGAEMHNLYPLLYNQVVYEVTQEVKGAGLVWSRAGYAGSQRYPTCWSGDPAADFDSLACTIRGGLSIGLSGVPFWSNDIGAYRGLPSERLYIRWAQFGLFCPHARCHGESQREPWFFGPRSVDIFRRYAELRYRLFPYLYSTAHEATRTGLPVMRAMPLAFPHDPNCYDKDLQYMFGPWLLVAPVYDEGEERTVYLPEGQWIDYWSGQTFHGPANIRVAAPLDVLPIFVRGGAILPQIPSAGRIPTGAVERLVVDVYPHQASEYRLYEDDGPTDFRCLSNEGLRFGWIGGAERPMLLRFHGITEPSEVEVRAGQDANALIEVQAGMAAGGVFEIRVPPARRGRLGLRLPDGRPRG